MSKQVRLPDGTVITDCFSDVLPVDMAPRCGSEEGLPPDSATSPDKELDDLERRARQILNQRALGLVYSVDWDAILPEARGVRFSDPSPSKASKAYPSLFVIRVTQIAAARSAAGQDNSLWQDVSDTIGLSKQRIAESFSEALRAIATSAATSCLVWKIPNNVATEHHHVMLANLHAILPVYAAADLWTVVSQTAADTNATAETLAYKLAASGNTAQPLRFLGAAALENTDCGGYIMSTLHALLWAHREGLFNVLDDLVPLGVPRHLVEALCRERRVYRSYRTTGYVCELEKIDDGHVLLVSRETRQIEVTPEILRSLYMGPVLFSKRNNQPITAPTKETLTAGLYVLLKDDEHELAPESGTLAPWSNLENCAGLRGYSLYSINKGSEPRILVKQTGQDYRIPVASDTVTAYQDEGILPQEVTVDGKRIYALDPVINASIGRLTTEDGGVSVTVHRGDRMFAALIGKTGTAGTTASVYAVPGFTAITNRVDGVRRYPGGVLLPEIVLTTPDLCGSVVGIPVKGKGYHADKPAMFIRWNGTEFPIRPKKPGHRHVDVLVAGQSIHIKLRIASWALEDDSMTISRPVDPAVDISYDHQCQLKYLNVDTVGWPARLFYTYEQSNQRGKVYLGSKFYSLDPSCHIGTELQNLSTLFESKGPIGNIRCYIEYHLPHRGTGASATALLFTVKKYRKCSTV